MPTGNDCQTAKLAGLAGYSGTETSGVGCGNSISQAQGTFSSQNRNGHSVGEDRTRWQPTRGTGSGRFAEGTHLFLSEGSGFFAEHPRLSELLHNTSSGTTGSSEHYAKDVATSIPRREKMNSSGIISSSISSNLWRVSDVGGKSLLDSLGGSELERTWETLAMKGTGGPVVNQGPPIPVSKDCGKSVRRYRLGFEEPRRYEKTSFHGINRQLV